MKIGSLQAASKCARALGLVDAGDFEDRRNPAPHLHLWESALEGVEPTVEGLDESPSLALPAIASLIDRGNLSIPAPPDTVGYERDDHRDRLFVVQLWIEKSTMNDVLVPLSPILASTWLLQPERNRSPRPSTCSSGARRWASRRGFFTSATSTRAARSCPGLLRGTSSFSAPDTRHRAK